MAKKTQKPTAVKTARMPSDRRLNAIATAFALDVPQLMSEAQDEILEAWASAEQEAQDQETAPKFKLGFGITLDLERDQMETKLTFGVRHSKTINRQMPDPSQPELPASDEGRAA